MASLAVVVRARDSVLSCSTPIADSVARWRVVTA
jgi:hypothetical protein